MAERHRRRLFFLTPFPPRLTGEHGGSRVMAQLICALAAHHEVAVLTLRGADEPPVDPAIGAALVEEVARPARVPSWGYRRHLLANWLAGRPIWAADWCVPVYGQRLASLAAAWKPDIVHVEYHIMAQYLPALARCPAPRILTEYEPGLAAARDRRPAPTPFLRLRDHIDQLAWGRYERAIMRAVQAVIVFTARDRAALLPNAGATPIATISPGTVVDQPPLDPLGATPPRLLFVGNFAHPPNVDAALRLIHTIFPTVKAQCPEARLVIVGPNPPDAIREAASPQITVTGWVDDVTPHLDQAAVVIAPIRLGGGVRIKVMEALVAGKAVVATPLAIEGLDLRDGHELRVATDDAELAAAAIHLIATPEARQALATAARTWALQHLGWPARVLAYEQLYTTLLQGAASRG